MSRMVAVILLQLLLLLIPATAERPAITSAVTMGGTGIQVASGPDRGWYYDRATAIAADSQGNAYIAGTASDGFPTTPGVVNQTRQPDSGSFLVKLDRNGQVVFSTYVPGLIQGITLDMLRGNIYLTGATTDSPSKVLVVEIDPNGSQQLYKYVFGGTRGDTGKQIGLDPLGYIYVAGETTSPDFPTTGGAFQTRAVCGTECHHAFVVKLNQGASQLIYSSYLGGSGAEEIGGFAVDTGGHAFVAGTTTSPDFPVTQLAFQTRFNQGASSTHSDGFVARVGPAGNTLEYSTYLGGSDDDRVEAMAMNGGSVYLTGNTRSTDFPVSGGAFQSQLAAAGSAFVMKLNADGATLAFSTLFGGTNGDTHGQGIAVEGSGDTVIGGWTSSDSLPTVTALQPVAGNDRTKSCMLVPGNPDTASECRDGFAARVDPAGAQVLWSTYLGGPENDSVEALTLGPGVVLLAGSGFAGVHVPRTKVGSAFMVRVIPDGITPVVPSAGVVNGGGFRTGIAPGALASIFGVGLSPVLGLVNATSVPLPMELGQTSVWIDGVAAPMLAVANINGREQLNVQVPFEAANGGATLIVKNKTTLGFAFHVNGGYVNPGIFVGGDGQAAAQHSVGYAMVSQSSPAKAGEFITIYATGLGPLERPVPTGSAATGIVRTKEQVTATIAGADAKVDFAGMSAYVGVNQLNVLVPKVAAGLKDLVIRVGGVSSNTAKVWVQ